VCARRRKNNFWFDEGGNDYEDKQDSFHFVCDETVSQELDDYEAKETYILEYVDPEVAIRKNRHMVQSPYNQMMFEREAHVLEFLIAEGLFER
jgi:hypothetical protein